MKTVGEFKNAGLVFVGNDKLRSETNNHDSDEICMNRCWLGHGSYSGFLEVSDCYFANKEWVISSFAWRENTGVKPEFRGLIEFTFSGEGSERQEAGLAENVNWEIVKKWRPSQNQHKKWPEKSRMDIIGQNGNDGLHYDNTAQQVEALAANNTLLQPRNPDPIFRTNEDAQKSLNEHLAKLAESKPIFTQAMADAYKMPAIGSWFTLHYHEHGSRFNDMDGHDFEVIGINDDIYTFRNDIKGYGALKLNTINCTPIDTRTEREKAIDDAMLKIGCHPSQDFIAGAPFIIGKLFDAELLNTKVS